MNLETLFCAPFGADGLERLGALLRDHRARRTSGFLPTSRASRADVPASRWALVDAYLAALGALLAGAPGRGAAHLQHWAPSFYLRYLGDRTSSPAVVEQASANLFATLLCERLQDGTSPLDGMSFVTRNDGAGAIHVFSEDARIRVPALARPHARLRWDCGDRSATVQPEDGTGAPVEVQLPLLEGADVERLPFERAQGWDIPIIEDCWAALMRTGDAPEYALAMRLSDGEARPPLPLCESLGATHRTLAELWPEVIPWVKIFIPAVVEVPPPGNRSVRLSGGTVPGGPIYLSRVADAYWHAEDLVHELQHARLLILSPVEQYFASFRDARTVFVSPYRLDPRPLTGLHLGVHAFVAVTALRLRALGAGLRDEVLVNDLLRLHRMNLFAYRTLVAHEQPSPEGRRFLDQIARALWGQHRAIEPRFEPRAAARVEAALEEHRAIVLGSGAPIENPAETFAPATAEELGAAGEPAPPPRPEVHS